MDIVELALATLAAGLVVAATAILVTQLVNTREATRLEQLSQHLGDRTKESSEESALDAKLNQALAASALLTSLTADISDALGAQVAETKQLQVDAAEAKAFMNANEDVVTAMRAMLRSELRDELKSEFESRGKADRRFQVGLAVGGFLAGIIGTIVFQIVWTATTGS